MQVFRLLLDFGKTESSRGKKAGGVKGLVGEGGLLVIWKPGGSGTDHLMSCIFSFTLLVSRGWKPHSETSIP